MKKQIFFIFLIICTAYFYGNKTYAQAATDTLTNKSVLDLKSAGLGTDVIKAKIVTSPCNFDLTTNGLIALKQAGLTDDVISMMVGKTSQASTVQAMMAAAANKGRPAYQDANGQSSTNSASAKIEAGIYYSKTGEEKPTELEASVYSQSKRGAGVLGSLTGGIAKTKMTSTVNGGNANLQITETRPVFLFYFDKNNANNSSFGSSNVWLSSATSPNEFILVKFNSGKKSREVVTGSYGTYSGMSSGIDDNNKVSFKYEKLAPGQYRVYFEEPLKQGEYGFMFANGAASSLGTMQKVYDFGVK
jgi:hypothetical protein